MIANRLENAVAVTGMACRFPGAPDVGAFWRNLCDGVNAITRFEAAELRNEGVTEELLDHKGFVPACAPIPEPYAFDAEHFRITPATARLLDLQHRVFLECAWTALEASGTLAARRRAVAVFAGCSETTPPFGEDNDDQGDALATSLGRGSDFFAARVAFLLDLRGPAFTVGAACATSLVAVHLAVQSLLTNECDVAVAGGASVRRPLRRGHIYELGGIYSSDGLCRPYDHLGSGIVSGDGAGAVVLRRFADAFADGDHIHAVICGSSVTNDGARKSSFTAPSVEGQVEAALTALEVAGIDPGTIGFVEGHGTATPLGDPIEVEALKRTWRRASKVRGPCVLGSVKSSIGHLDAAAGIAGLIKACLAVEHGRIPGTLNYSEPNPHCGLVESPFRVLADTTRWEDNTGPRRASVNSLGLGGTNAHVVLEQAPPPSRGFGASSSAIPVALTLSTRRPQAMKDYAEALGEVVARHDGDVAAVAETLQHGRVSEPFRRVVVGRDCHELARSLLAVRPPQRPAVSRPRLVLVFPGDGKRLPGALTQLAEHLSPVATTMREAADHLRLRWEVDLWEVVLGAEPSTRGILAAIVAQGVAVHAALDSFGAGGDLVLGQSLGETTAAVASGLISLHDALDLAMAREHAFRAVSPSGALAVGLAPTALQERLPPQLELSLVNSPNRCVISGELDALAAFASELAADEIPVHRLELISAVHSALLDPVLGEFSCAAARLRARPPVREFLSSVGPALVDERTAADSEHWVRQLRETVRFDDCLRTAVSGDDTIVIDVGPTGGLTSSLHETVGGDARAIVRVAPHTSDETEIEAFAQALGKLWEHGVAIDWQSWPRRVTQRISLPVPSLARTLYEPIAVNAARRSERADASGVALWARNWRRVDLARDDDGVRRIAVIAGVDSIYQDLAAYLARSGHDVSVIQPEARPLVTDRVDAIIDTRALSEQDGPTAVAALLELTAEIIQQRNRSLRFVILTRGAFDIVGTEVLSLSAAAVAAASLVVAQEHSNLDLACVDLAGDGIPQTLARALLSPVWPGVWLGLRGRTLWRPTLELLEVLPRRDRPLAAGVCVITGGLGRFGRWVGRWLAQYGCPELVLVNRSGTPKGPGVDAVTAMRRAGARVTVVAADVSDHAAICGVLDRVSRSAEAPVTILHLAGEPNAPSAFAPMVDLARGDPHAALQEQWAAKVEGACALLEWTRRHPEARCVVFSSNAAVLGGPGLAAYAAANAAVDLLAISARDREGLDWCAIGWDGWRLPNESPVGAPSALEAFALRGEEPWKALCDAVSTGRGHVVVAKGDLETRHRAWVENRDSLDPEPGTPLEANGDLAGQKYVTDVVSAVRTIWLEVLGIVPDGDMDLFEAGGDSLSAMRIRTRIERTLGIALTIQEVLQNRTVAGLATLMQARLDEVRGEASAADEGSAPPRTGDEIIRGRL